MIIMFSSFSELERRKFRTYNGSHVEDLLRAIRNKVKITMVSASACAPGVIFLFKDSNMRGANEAWFNPPPPPLLLSRHQKKSSGSRKKGISLRRNYF